MQLCRMKDYQNALQIGMSACLQECSMTVYYVLSGTGTCHDHSQHIHVEGTYVN